MAPGVARGAEHGEPVGIAHVVAEGDDRGRPELGQQALERPRACRRRSAAGGPRPAGPGSGPDRAPGSSRSTSSIAATTAARAATRSSAWRTWNATDGPLALDEQPGRPSRAPRGRARARISAGSTRRLVAGAERRHEAGRAAAPRERPGLQPVVAQVADAADPDPRRDVGRGPAGQDRDGDPLGPGGGDAGEPAEGAPRERHDDRRAGVARALGERAVEVGDDEQPPGSRRQPGDRSDARSRPRLGDRRSRRDVDARAGSSSVRPP